LEELKQAVPPVSNCYSEPTKYTPETYNIDPKTHTEHIEVMNAEPRYLKSPRSSSPKILTSRNIESAMTTPIKTIRFIASESKKKVK